ncbi:MAG: biotin/lipoate A/B protein ligase family protein, partial [Anaerolineales bacterium]|nr:biotin/lipoate A/B protein ligase family protein [Anaerolineales bacterium]
TLRLFAWNPPCLSLGHAQSFSDVDMDRVKEHGWEVVRRVTGGRAILHTDELTYSVTGSAEEPILAGGVLESYNRIAQALLYAVRELGFPVVIKEDGYRYALREGRSVILDLQSETNPICFEVPSTYEITVDGKKLIGSAQARKKEGVLQHGSLPLKGDLARICQALVFKNEAARENAARRLLTRAATIESVLGVETAWETAAQAFVKGFEAQLGIHFQRGEMSRSESERAEQLVKEKYANPAWTERI